ncbi:MAG: hypothetical protein ACFFCW_11635 [Candidatus Hodarchaeota archaeon]
MIWTLNEMSGYIIETASDWNVTEMELFAHLRAQNQFRTLLNLMFKALFDAIAKSQGAVQKAWNELTNLRSKLTNLFTTSNQWTESQLADFRDNVLLTNDIGITGGMTYLQIQEQMELNQDLLIAKHRSLEAALLRREALANQVAAQTRELAMLKRHESDLAKIMQDMSAGEITELSQAKRRLTRVGQGVLDALMRRLQIFKFQLKFLDLDTTALHGLYNYYIDGGNVGEVTADELEILSQKDAWIAENGHIGWLKVSITRSGPGPIGTYTVVDPTALDLFKIGERVHPSHLQAIEPLRETRLVTTMALAIQSRLADPAELVKMLTEQFIIQVEGSDTLVDIETFGDHNVLELIIGRERGRHTVLNSSVVGKLEDVEVILAYVLAMGGVTPVTLNSIIQEPTLSELLRTRLEKLLQIWSAIPGEIESENVISLRRESERINDNRSDPAAVKNRLNDVFITPTGVATLERFGLIPEDIDQEIEFLPVLNNVYSGDTLNLILTVMLLNGKVDVAQLQAIANLCDSTHPIGQRVKGLVTMWPDLRAYVLATKHALGVNISDISSASGGEHAHRFLAVRAAVETTTGTVNKSLQLKKLAPDIFQDYGVKEFEWQVASQSAWPNPLSTPPGFNINDYHWNELFGRSILGKWELTLELNGNEELSDVTNIEVEFMCSYKQ